MTLTADARDQLAGALRADARAGRMIQGRWEKEDTGQGCGLWCLARDAVALDLVTQMPYRENQAEVAELLGVPIQVMHLIEAIYNYGKCQQFPARLLAALQPGADYSRLRLARNRVGRPEDDLHTQA